MKHFLILSLILGFLNLTASENLPRTTSIDKIKVGKILSTKNLASKNIKYFLDGEKASFVNLSKTQIMTLDFCCGANGEIQRINVKFFDKNLTEGNINFSKLKEFATNLGIKLGDKQEQNGTTTANYITEQNESKLLQEFDMPLYYEKFIFSDGVLKEYEFGFEYP